MWTEYDVINIYLDYYKAMHHPFSLQTFPYEMYVK